MTLSHASNDTLEQFDDMDPGAWLARHAAGVQFEQLPTTTISFQKRRLLDNIGCGLAGANADGVAAALAVWGDDGGQKQATVIHDGRKLPLLNAVCINAVMARALDFCDVTPPGHHPSSADVPIGLAVSEFKQASGQDLLTALAVGQDVSQRINRASIKGDEMYHGFDGNVLGLFSGSVIAGKLLRLNGEQMGQAMGMAYNYGIGTFQPNKDKTLGVRFIQSFMARAGLEAALLAQKGVTGLYNTLSGELGFFNQYARRAPNLDLLAANIGEIFEGGEEQMIFKIYPSCGVTLALTDAVLDIVGSETFDASDVLAIDLEISPTMEVLCGDKFDSQTASSIDGMFSVEYVAANALVRKRSTLAEFTEDAVRAPEIAALAERTRMTTKPGFAYGECAVRVSLTDGRVFERHEKYGTGWPQRPATQEQVEQKFRDCVAFSPLPNDRAGAIIEFVNELETHPSIEPLLTLCTAG